MENCRLGSPRKVDGLKGKAPLPFLTQSECNEDISLSFFGYKPASLNEVDQLCQDISQHESLGMPLQQGEIWGFPILQRCFSSQIPCMQISANRETLGFMDRRGMPHVRAWQNNM